MGLILLAALMPGFAAPVAVAPAHPSPRAAVRVSWMSRSATRGRRFAVSAIATRAARGGHSTGCDAQAEVFVTNFKPGERLARHLRPRGRWCRDLYRGRVSVAPSTPPCTDPHCTSVNPLVGRFRFRIR
jgi:hypothetical protein